MIASASAISLPDGRRPFLTADWRNLVLVNFAVPASLLLPRVPPGCELDGLPGAPDVHVLSAVAMHFNKTRVYGVPVPMAQRFDELNLRFYVRQGDRHGSVFVRQYVPSRLIVSGARWPYNQRYERATIRHEVFTCGGSIRAETSFEHCGYSGRIALEARDEPVTPPRDSLEHFLKERYWGFDSDRRGRVFRYRVWHPVWRTYPIRGLEVDFDPGALLGGAWASVDWREALHSAVFAEGSLSAIFPAEPVDAVDAAMHHPEFTGGRAT
jgi:uncharacterized protein